MSKHVIIKTEFKDVKAVCVALTKVGLNHSVKGNVVTVARGNAGNNYLYTDLIIDCNTGQVGMDDMNKDVLQRVTQQYAYVKTVEQVKEMGFSFVEPEKNVNGEIVMTVSRWVS